jgi:hypothetical protein
MEEPFSRAILGQEETGVHRQSQWRRRTIRILLRRALDIAPSPTEECRHYLIHQGYLPICLRIRYASPQDRNVIAQRNLFIQVSSQYDYLGEEDSLMQANRSLTQKRGSWVLPLTANLFWSLSPDSESNPRVG